jgi:hypothetical protein
MKIIGVFLIIWGKGAEVETEPEFLTSWSRGRTKMDRLRNTGIFLCTSVPYLLQFSLHSIRRKKFVRPYVNFYTF